MTREISFAYLSAPHRAATPLAAPCAAPGGRKKKEGVASRIRLSREHFYVRHRATLRLARGILRNYRRETSTGKADLEITPPSPSFSRRTAISIDGKRENLPRTTNRNPCAFRQSTSSATVPREMSQNIIFRSPASNLFQTDRELHQ